MYFGQLLTIILLSLVAAKKSRGPDSKGVSSKRSTFFNFGSALGPSNSRSKKSNLRLRRLSRKRKPSMVALRQKAVQLVRELNMLTKNPKSIKLLFSKRPSGKGKTNNIRKKAKSAKKPKNNVQKKAKSSKKSKLDKEKGSPKDIASILPKGFPSQGSSDSFGGLGNVPKNNEMDLSGMDPSLEDPSMPSDSPQTDPGLGDPSIPSDPLQMDPSMPSDPSQMDPSMPSDPSQMDPSMPSDPSQMDPSMPSDPSQMDPSMPSDPSQMDPSMPSEPSQMDPSLEDPSMASDTSQMESSGIDPSMPSDSSSMDPSMASDTSIMEPSGMDPTDSSKMDPSMPSEPSQMDPSLEDLSIPTDPTESMPEDIAGGSKTASDQVPGDLKYPIDAPQPENATPKVKRSFVYARQANNALKPNEIIRLSSMIIGAFLILL